MFKTKQFLSFLAGPARRLRYHRNVISRQPLFQSTVRHLSNKEKPQHSNGRCDEPFELSKALIISKLSRLELEQHRNSNLSERQLKEVIRNRGSDYDAMQYYHEIHKKFERKVAESFTEHGVLVQLVNRLTLTREHIKWADMLVPIGGDGTFLMTAGRASPLFPELCNTPVVGFNSDPSRSEGMLMLPKQYSNDPREAVRKIINGNFKWMHRSRIKVTLLSQSETQIPIAMDLHDHHHFKPIPVDYPPAEPLTAHEALRYDSKVRNTLPYLALNEVFIGETMSARVSHLQIAKDDNALLTKTKSSGLCVSTGTGSTSWMTSINRLSVKNVQKLLSIISPTTTTIDATALTNEYNRQLIFPADDPRLCYSIREQICVGVWPNPKGFQSRDFARRLLVKSRCVDASLVIDGSIAYPFNDGAKALLEVHPDDSLLTICINGD